MKNIFEPMEQEITTEENQVAKPPTKASFSFQQIISPQFLKKFKTTNFSSKLLTLLILMGIILVIFLALVLVSTQVTNQPTRPTTQITSPQPQASAKPQLGKIVEKVQDFNLRLDKLDNYSQKLPKPIVDLAIQFQ